MYRGMGTTYDFSSSVPLLGRFSVDMPIAAMTQESVETMRQEVKADLPWIIVTTVVSAFVGASLANWIVPGRRRA